MIVVIVMMFCMVFIAVGAYLFLNRPQEGDECAAKTPDDNALTYEIDDEGKCVLKSCKSGYIKSGQECIVEEDDGPACQDDMTFADQTGTFTCESLDDFKPEGATWWGTYINNSVPVSSEEATAQGFSHSFHELSSSPTEKKYIAMRKTDQHCKMVQFDITKSGNTCSYAINDAGYAGFGGGGMGANEACTATTDTEVIAKWNAKTAVPTARTAATDTGYGLKSLDYSMYC